MNNIPRTAALAALITLPIAAGTSSAHTETVAAAGRVACVPTAIHRGAPPKWTAAAWSDSSPGFTLPYALASHVAAAAFFWTPTLRAGHPTNPTNKVLWVVRYPRHGQPLRILARSGASPMRTVYMSFPADASPGEIYPSYVDLPSPGCWELTLRWDMHIASLNVNIDPPANVTRRGTRGSKSRHWRPLPRERARLDELRRPRPPWGSPLLTWKAAASAYSPRVVPSRSATALSPRGWSTLPVECAGVSEWAHGW